MTDEHAPSRSEFAKEMPAWFGAISGLIYATGFLVVLCHFHSLGLRTFPTEFFRLRYFLVGILCLWLESLIIGPIYMIGWLAFIRSTMNLSPSKLGTRHLPALALDGTLLALNLLVVFYAMIFLVPEETIRTRPFALAYLLTATIGGLMALGARRAIFGRDGAGSTIAPWVVCATVILVGDVMCLYAAWAKIISMFFPYGIAFCLLAGAIGLIAVRTATRVRRSSDSASQPLAIAWAAAICLFLHFLCVVLFAAGIYPFIGSRWGGGYYGDCAPMVLFFNASSAPDIPPQINKGGHSQPLVLIDESEKALTVMDPGEFNYPSDWRRSFGPKTIIVVNRDMVSGIVYERGKDRFDASAGKEERHCEKGPETTPPSGGNADGPVQKGPPQCGD